MRTNRCAYPDRKSLSLGDSMSPTAIYSDGERAIKPSHPGVMNASRLARYGMAGLRVNGLSRPRSATWSRPHAGLFRQPNVGFARQPSRTNAEGRGLASHSNSCPGDSSAVRSVLYLGDDVQLRSRETDEAHRVAGCRPGWLDRHHSLSSSVWSLTDHSPKAVTIGKECARFVGPEATEAGRDAHRVRPS